MKTKLQIVPVDDIPVSSATPTDDLMLLYRTCLEMEQVCDLNGGIGLSASQVGLPWRLFIINRNGWYEHYLNCEYEGIGEKVKSAEGCLSLRKDGHLRRFEVERHPKARIKGQKLALTQKGLELEAVDREESGVYAIVFQHEIDHDSRRERMIDVIGKEIDIW